MGDKITSEAEVRARAAQARWSAASLETREKYERLRQASVDCGKCRVCGYIPKLKHGCAGEYRGWRLAVRKQAMGAHFRKHEKELLGGGGGEG